MKSNRQIKPLIFVFLLMLWIAGLLAAYYLYHKPIDLTLVSSILRIGWILITAFWILSLAGGLGKRLFPWTELSAVERAFLQLMLGLGIFSTIIFFLVWIGIGFKVEVWLLFILPLPFLWRSIPLWWADWKATFIDLPQTSRFGHLLALFAGLLCLQALLIALSPPVQYDALTYHLAFPKLYLDSGSITAGVSWFRSGMPQTGEMLYTWAMVTGQVSSAPVLSWAVGVAGILALISFIRRFINPDAGWVGAAALLCGSGLSSALGWGYIDWFCLVFGLAAILALQAYFDHQQNSWLLFSGVFCGLAFSAKYTAGVILAGVGIAFLLASLHSKRPFWAGGVLLLAGFLIPSLPWLVKNWILLGNPVAPYFWGTTVFPAARQQVIQGNLPFGNWMDILLLPFRATIIGADGGQGYSHTIGVLFLLLGGLCWIRPGLEQASKRWYQILVTISVVTLLAWIVGNRFSGLLIQNRMYYAAFPAFACLAAIGYFKLSQIQVPGVRVGRIISAVILLVLGLNVIQGGRELIRSQAPDYLTGVISTEEYKEKNLGWYQRAVSTVAESKQKTLLIYEPRGLECLDNCQPDEILDRWSYDFHRLGSCEAVTNDWVQKGFTQILVNQSGLDFFMQNKDPNHTKDDLLSLEACIATLDMKQDFGNAYSLYQLQ